MTSTFNFVDNTGLLKIHKQLGHAKHVNKVTYPNLQQRGASIWNNSTWCMTHPTSQRSSLREEGYSAQDNYYNIRPDLKIYWFVVTRVCCFQYTRPVGKFFFFHFEMERIALILIYLTWISSSSLCSICVYFFCNVDATIMILAYLNPQNPWLASKRLHGTSFPRLSLPCPSAWMGWCCNYWLEG